MTLHSHPHLGDGSRLRVRLPQARDRARLQALHERLGLELSELDVVRVLRFDPVRESVLCASAWIDGRETLVGYAMCPRDRPDAATVLADESLAPGCTDALTAGLASLARAA